MWERWRKFVCGALAVAENYSTKSCQCDEEILAAWRKELCELWKIQVPSKQEATEGEYVTTVLHEMLQAWVKESGDPNGVVVKWLKDSLENRTGHPDVRVFPPRRMKLTRRKMSEIP